MIMMQLLVLVRRTIILLLASSMLSACGAVRLGRHFPINPTTELKIGHDRKADVERRMGPPYRRFVDDLGHEVFTYLWADGRGNGQKCLIAFNQNDVVYLVEVTQ